MRDGTSFDVWTSAVVIVGYSIPGFLFAILLIRVLRQRLVLADLSAARSPVRQLGPALLVGKAVDYLWHIALPITAMALGAFATSTLLTKNSFLDEIRKQYVLTARAKGLSERRVLYNHVFRNAMLIVIAGFPGAFIGAFFDEALSSSLLARRPRASLLRVDRQPRLPRRLRVALRLLAARPGGGPHIRPHYTWIDPRIDFETGGVR